MDDARAHLQFNADYDHVSYRHLFGFVSRRQSIPRNNRDESCRSVPLVPQDDSMRLKVYFTNKRGILRRNPLAIRLGCPMGSCIACPRVANLESAANITKEEEDRAASRRLPRTSRGRIDSLHANKELEMDGYIGR